MNVNFLFSALGIFSWISFSFALTPVENPSTVVCQKTIGKMACGPCALINALRFGGINEQTAEKKIAGQNDLERVQTVINQYGTRPSDPYPDRKRFEPARGMTDRELLGMVNDLLADQGLIKVHGGYLDRTEQTPRGEHLHRIYELFRHSINQGFPPLVLIRSFSAYANQRASDGFYWKGMLGHWVPIIKVPDELPPDAISFTMQVADSSTGKIQDFFVYEEHNRNFIAAKGDDRTWAWTKVPEAFLVVVAPGLSMDMGDIPWYLRGNIILDYGIYRE